MANSIQTIRDYLATIPEIRAELKRLQETYVPPTISQAIGEKWKAEISSEVETIESHALAYDEDARLIDSRRTITAKRALNIMQDMEDALVGSEVTTFGQHLWRDMRAIPTVLKFLFDDWKLLWAGLQSLFTSLIQAGAEVLVALGLGIPIQLPAFDYTNLIAAVAAIWAGICTLILSVISLKRIKLTMRATLKQRDRTVRLLRAFALPQRHGRRYRRRKVTRR